MKRSGTELQTDAGGFLGTVVSAAFGDEIVTACNSHSTLAARVAELEAELRLANRGKEAELREAVEETALAEAAVVEIDRLRTQNAALVEALEAIAKPSTTPISIARAALAKVGR